MDYNKKWEKILKIIETSMNLHYFKLWIIDLKLIKIDEELKSVLVGSRDPFRAAVVSRRFGANLDRAAQIVLGSEYRVFVTYDMKMMQEDDNLIICTTSFDGDDKVRAMLIVNDNVSDEELTEMKLAEFACIDLKIARERTVQEDVEQLKMHLKNMNRVMPDMVEIVQRLEESNAC